MIVKETFEVTEDHLKLAARMYVNWDASGYDGAPGINLKRPYGNSDALYDVYEIVKGHPWPYPNDEEMPPSIKSEMHKIHREMDKVLQIALCNLGFQAGVYVKHEAFRERSWRPVETFLRPGEQFMTSNDRPVVIIGVEAEYNQAWVRYTDRSPTEGLVPLPLDRLMKML